MRILKNILSQLHRYVVWAILLSILWVFIYSRVDDRPAEKKLVFYLGTYELNSTELTLYLEDQGMPQGIEMIRARSASYNLFGMARDGDLYLVRESDLRTMLSDAAERVAPIQAPPGTEPFLWEGRCYGIRAFDPETQRGPAMAWVQYAPLPEREREAYYLVFDAGSLHLASNPGAVDNAAWELAERFLAIEN